MRRAEAVARIAKYLDRYGPAVEGQGGRTNLFRLARELTWGLALDPDVAVELMYRCYNPKCAPPWSDRELRQAVEGAGKNENGAFALPYGWLLGEADGDEVEADGDPVEERTDGEEASGGPPADGPNAAAAGPSAGGSRFRFEDVTTFLAGDHRPTWLVPRVLVRGPVGVIAGPSKSLKTSILLDLAVSVAAGKPFLGAFPVPTRARVAVVSGESGKFTIGETVRRVMAARGVAAADLAGHLALEFSLPTFTDPASMADLAGHLGRVGADVLVVDPTYLVLGDVEAGNMFDMGAVLRRGLEALRRARPDLTVLMVHHANRQLAVGEAMELRHLAYSGLEQFVGQWVLVNRRVPFAGDGTHDLWVDFGGREGQCGRRAVRVEEGVTDEDFAGRKWDVTVATPDEARASAADQREEVRFARKQRQMDRDDETVMRVIGEECDGTSGIPTTKNHIRVRGKFSSAARVNEAIGRLVEQGAIRAEQVKAQAGANKREVTVYVRNTGEG